MEAPSFHKEGVIFFSAKSKYVMSFEDKSR